MDDKSSSKICLISLGICLFVSMLFAWSFYHEDLIKYENAYADKIKLYPPTDREIKQWEYMDKQLQIKQKQKEIVLLKMGVTIPDDIDKEVFEHLTKYPEGHNPSKEVLNKLIDEVKRKTLVLYSYAFVFSILASIIIGIIYYEKIKKNISNDKTC
jgi:hypothetical protein